MIHSFCEMIKKEKDMRRLWSVAHHKRENKHKIMPATCHVCVCVHMGQRNYVLRSHREKQAHSHERERRCLCVCVCVCVCTVQWQNTVWRYFGKHIIRVYAYGSEYVHTSVLHTHVYLYVCVCVCNSECIHTCVPSLCTCICCVYVCMQNACAYSTTLYIYMSACICVCTHECVYLCIYVCAFSLLHMCVHVYNYTLHTHTCFCVCVRAHARMRSLMCADIHTTSLSTCTRKVCVFMPGACMCVC